MIYLRLYLVFVKIGALAFGGGYATLPLIQQFIVQENKWLTITEMTDLISISQMTPGPIAINAATFVGTKVGGITGSIIATIGIVTPSFILMMILSYFLFNDRKVAILDNMLVGLRPGIVALIAIAAQFMIYSSIFGNSFMVSSIDRIAIICFVIGLALYLKKVSIINIIIVGGIMGIILSSVL